MLHVVYINNEGFICTFNKSTKSYTTTKDINDADFNSELEHAESTANFFNGIVLSVKDEEK